MRSTISGIKNLMGLKIEEIKKHILEALPDAYIEIKDLMGDNNHYSAIIRSSKFNNFYRDCKVIGDTNEAFRINLVNSSKRILFDALDILGVEAPDRM